jgi:hypothetical protein
VSRIHLSGTVAKLPVGAGMNPRNYSTHAAFAGVGLDLAVLEDRAVVFLGGGRVDAFDLDSLAWIPTASTSSSTQILHAVADPCGGMLAIYVDNGSATYMLGRFDAQARLKQGPIPLMATGPTRPAGPLDVYSFGACNSDSIGVVIWTAGNAANVRAEVFDGGTFVSRTSTTVMISPQAIPIAGSFPSPTAGDQMVAFAANDHIYALHVFPGAGAPVVFELPNGNVMIGPVHPHAMVYDTATGNLLLPVYYQQFGVWPVQGDFIRGRPLDDPNVAFYEVEARPVTAMIRWPGSSSPNPQIIGLVRWTSDDRTNPETFVANFEAPSASERFTSGALDLGFGVPTRIREDKNGNVWVLLGWAGDLIRLRPKS